MIFGLFYFYSPILRELREHPEHLKNDSFPAVVVNSERSKSNRDRERCGGLAEKGRLDSQHPLQLRRLLKELMELASPPLLQVLVVSDHSVLDASTNFAIICTDGGVYMPYKPRIRRLHAIHIIFSPILRSFGASSGIGAETARVLALRNVHVLMAVRNIESGKEVKEAIIKENPAAKVDAMELDLSSIASVRKFASNFHSTGLPLNILINNAGIMMTPFMLSKDNVELQFATNHIGHFLLTNLLLETMKKTAQQSQKEGRIVNLSSRRHKLSYREGIRFDRINNPSGYDSLSAYGQSKLANVLHANELARRLKADGVNVTANSVHPGAIETNLFRHSNFITGLVGVLGKYLLKNVQQGAATTCYVAMHPQVQGTTGNYFADCNTAEMSIQAKDAEMAKKLWSLSLDLINSSPSVSYR